MKQRMYNSGTLRDLKKKTFKSVKLWLWPEQIFRKILKNKFLHDF